jgi:hypothetical protein
MRAQFVRDAGNPLDNLGIGHVKERKRDRMNAEMTQALEKLMDDEKIPKPRNPLNHKSTEGHLKLGFFIGGYFYYLYYDMRDDQLFAGWELWDHGHKANWDSNECKTWERGIDWLRGWIEEGGNK